MKKIAFGHLEFGTGGLERVDTPVMANETETQQKVQKNREKLKFSLDITDDGCYHLITGQRETDRHNSNTRG